MSIVIRYPSMVCGLNWKCSSRERLLRAAVVDIVRRFPWIKVSITRVGAFFIIAEAIAEISTLIHVDPYAINIGKIIDEVGQLQIL